MEPTTPDLWTLGAVAALAGLFAAGITDLLKLVLKRYFHPGCAGDPRWWAPVLRSTAIGLGCGVGAALLEGPWGLATGAAGGLFSTLIYRAMRRRVQAFGAGSSGGAE